MTKILGLTGSIGMGKTTAANMFRDMGVPVFDSDATVHALKRSNPDVINHIAERIPSAKTSRGVDPDVVARMALNDPDLMVFLENLIHPKVLEAQKKFLEENWKKKIVVLDIPLLFETHAEERCDAVIVMSAPRLVQLRRVLKRPGMSWKKFRTLEKRQMKDKEKRKRADFVVSSAKGKSYTRKKLEEIVREMI